MRRAPRFCFCITCAASDLGSPCTANCLHLLSFNTYIEYSIVKVYCERPSYTSQAPSSCALRQGNIYTILTMATTTGTAATVVATSMASATANSSQNLSSNNGILSGENPSIYSPSNPVRTMHAISTPILRKHADIAHLYRLCYSRSKHVLSSWFAGPSISF
jgi:hypothetical protein